MAIIYFTRMSLKREKVYKEGRKNTEDKEERFYTTRKTGKKLGQKIEGNEGVEKSEDNVSVPKMRQAGTDSRQGQGC